MAEAIIVATEPIEPSRPAAPPTTEPLSVDDEPLVEDDLLVEDVSIDGMCGVY